MGHKFFRCMVIVLCCIAFLLLGVRWGYKEKFQTYLETSYQKDFVVMKISYDPFHGLFSAYAYVREQPQVIFYVGHRIKTKELEDGYFTATWDNQARQEIGTIVEKFYPDARFGVSVFPLWEQIDLNNYIDPPLYTACTKVSIGVSMPYQELNFFNQHDEIERLYHFMEDIREKEIPLESIDISYNSQSLRIEADGIESITDLESLRDYLRNRVKPSGTEYFHSNDYEVVNNNYGFYC